MTMLITENSQQPPQGRGGLKPGLQPCVLFRGQTSPQVALVQWNCCIMWAKLCILRIYVIQLCIKTCKMQRFHWTRATRGDVWPRNSTHGCKPGFRPPCKCHTLVICDWACSCSTMRYWLLCRAAHPIMLLFTRSRWDAPLSCEGLTSWIND